MNNEIRTLFEKLNQASTDEEKIALLKSVHAFRLIPLLRYAFNTNSVFDVSIPDFTKRDPRDLFGRQSIEDAVNMLKFIETSNTTLTSEAKVNLLKDILERLSDFNADLLVSVIQKNITILTKEIVNQAFPGLLD